MAGLGCKTSTFPWRPILAIYGDDLDILVNALKKSDNHDKKPTAPLQSDLAQETRSKSPRGQTEKVGMLRGNTSWQIQVEAPQQGTRLLELGRPESSLRFLQRHH